MSASSSASTCKRFAPWLLALAVAGACGASAIPHPTEADTQWARSRWPETTSAQLAEGRDLYVSKCGGCHTLYEPGHVVAVDWPTMFDEMADRAKLGDPQRERVRHYLTAITRRE